MKRLIIFTAIILALFTAIGYGFSQVGNQRPPEKAYPVLLTLTELQFVINSLEKEPYKDAAPIIQKIITQYNTQAAADTIKPKK